MNVKLNGNVHGCLATVQVRGEQMSGLITMDDLTNEEILSILDDAERLLPVAKGEIYLPLLQGRILGNLFLNQVLEQECLLKQL